MPASRKHHFFFSREMEEISLFAFYIIPFHGCIIVYTKHELKITKLSY